MKHTDSIIVGGGQAGLAMSRCLSDRGIDHVVLERGRVAERWRSTTWDSLRLLTPRWQARLPGWSYSGADADGYMTVVELIRYLKGYAESFSAPVEEETEVLSVERHAFGDYVVRTTGGDWVAPTVVLATGACDTPWVPDFARSVDPRVDQIVPARYRNPRQLRDGGVLVVGAAATGVQLADEIHRSGRPVTLSVGRHTRLPRTYRGRDILEWLDTMGVFDERAEDVRDLDASRRSSSLQLVGRDDKRTLDLSVLQRAGVRLTGGTVGADGRHVRFAADLCQTTVAADAKLARVLRNVDEFIERERVPATDERHVVGLVDERNAPREVDLRAEGIRTIVWATGFRRRYPWLHLPIVGGDGELVHHGGITPARGVYALGLRFMRRRKSNFIDGVGDDAREIASHLAETLRGPQSQAA